MSLRDEYVLALERQNEALQEHILNLEAALGIQIETPLELDLTSQESALLGLLLKRDIVTKELAMTAFYGLRADGEEPEIKIIDVLIHKLRRKLKSYGIAIATKWGQGWWMTAEAKAIIRGMMKVAA
jgi:two-component system cell cycle response regulator CtrA